MRFRPNLAFCIPTECSKADCPLQFFLVCASVFFFYVALVLYLFVPYLSFFWCLGMNVLRDYGISLISLLIVLYFETTAIQIC